MFQVDFRGIILQRSLVIGFAGHFNLDSTGLIEVIGYIDSLKKMENIKILIVEDELLIAESLSKKLKQFHHQVVDIVSSGQAAIEKANSLNPDLILMDIVLKGQQDGIQAACAIRESRNIPIIFLTAYEDQKTLERVYQTGCYGYILKPYKNSELKASIQIAINRYQEQNAIEQSLCRSDIYQDTLTKLPNQKCLPVFFKYSLYSLSTQPSQIPSVPRDRLEKLIQNPTTVAVIHLSLDRFQNKSNLIGKYQTNILLKAIAKRLERYTNDFNNSPIEDVTIKLLHLEGCQFAILLANAQQKQVEVFCQELVQAFHQPFLVSSRQIVLTASIGVSLYPLHGSEIDELLDLSRSAMEYAQQQGGDRYKIYLEAYKLITGKNADTLSLEVDLHSAITKQELELYYLPKINLKTGQIVGAKSLLRWNHPELGLLDADKFIFLAETSRLIESIGEWLIKQACRQIKIWHEIGYESLKISVNLSSKQFKQPNFFARISDMLYDSAIKPQFFELGLTEKTLVEDAKNNVHKLNLIKFLGISISLNDFAMGNSSLEYLQKFPFTSLKIDSRFIRNLEENSKNAVIIKTIIEMAHKLGLTVVAEGIERQSDLDFMIKHQCDQAQGSFFSTPLSPQEFTKLLANNDFSSQI